MGGFAEYAKIIVLSTRFHRKGNGMSIIERLPFLNQLSPAAQVIVLNLILLALALIVIWVLRNTVIRLVMIPIRGLAGRTKTDLDNRVLDTIERPMRLFILGAGVAIVTAIFDFNPQIDAFTNTIARALILAGVIFLIYNLVDLVGLNSNTLHNVMGISIEDRLLPFLRTVVKVFILVMGGLIIIQEFGYDVTGLIASFGVIGLAIGLAAKDTAANVFGFTAIVSDNPFKVGDYIVMGDFSGVVEHVGVRSTRVRKLDQSLVAVPNSKLTDSPLTNWSRLSKRRMDFYLTLTDKTNSEQVRELLQRIKDMLRAREQVDAEAVQVFLTEIADNKPKIRVIAYILLSDWGAFMAQVEDINLELMELLAAMGLAFDTPRQPLAEIIPDVKELTNSVPDGDDNIGKSEETYQDNPSASSDSGNNKD
jgi:MscS family membrane protein